MGWKRIDSARKIPLAEGPIIAAVIGKMMEPLIQTAMLEPASHLPVCQHCLMSHLRKGGRTLERGRQPFTTPTAVAAKLAAPASKINPGTVQRSAARKPITPPSKDRKSVV